MVLFLEIVHRETGQPLALATGPGRAFKGRFALSQKAPLRASFRGALQKKIRKRAVK